MNSSLLKRLPQKFSGVVQAGKKEARKLDIPTANISINSKVDAGVYFSKCKLYLPEDKNLEYSAISYIPPDASILETHIFGFAKEIYGVRIDIELIEFVRKYRDFKDDIETLKLQIQADIRKVHEIAKNNLIAYFLPET